MNLGMSEEIDDKFGCKGDLQTVSIIEKVSVHAYLIFLLNLDLTLLYFKLPFVWCHQSCGSF